MTDTMTRTSRSESAVEIRDRIEIEQVINSERNGKDLGRWDDMLDAHHPSARLGGFWFEGDVRAFVESSRKSWDEGLRQVHLLGPMDIQTNGSRALCEYNMFIRSHVDLRGIRSVTQTSIRAYDKILKWENKWKLYERNVSYQAAEVWPVNSWETIDFDRLLLESYPPSYRYVAHTLAALGHKVSKDLPCVDRPELVADIEAKGARWLAGED